MPNNELKPTTPEEREEWRGIPGFYGLYEASNLGRVRRLRFINGQIDKILNDPSVKAQGKAPNGYWKVSLYRNGQVFQFGVHRLVLMAFIGPCPDGCEAAHKDNVKANNRLTNLEWKTHVDNIKDKIRHGTAQVGERNPSSTLKCEDVKAIRQFKSDGLSQAEISRRFNISENAVSMIVRRKAWKHI